MTTFATAHTSARGLSLARAADAMLRSLGAGEIVLRVSAPGNVTDALELGLAEAPVQDIVLTPVVLRRVEPDSAALPVLEVLISAAALERAAESQGVAPRDLLDAAVGFLHDARLLRITAIHAEDFAGVPYLWRVRICE